MDESFYAIFDSEVHFFRIFGMICDDRIDISGMIHSCYGWYSLLLIFCMLVEKELMYNCTE